jgi:hypothetical protein
MLEMVKMLRLLLRNVFLYASEKYRNIQVTLCFVRVP